MTTRVIVIGASAGGLDALSRLTAQLPKDLAASVFIVQHMSAEADGAALRRAVTKNGGLVCEEAQDGARFHPGCVYVAPSASTDSFSKERLRSPAPSPHRYSPN